MTSQQSLYHWRFNPTPGAITHTLFQLCHAILGFTPAIRTSQTLPNRTRKHIALRMAFYAGKILSLILRLTPEKCGELFMRSARTPRPAPRPANVTHSTKPATQTQTPHTTPKHPLSARQAATRLANYVAKVEALAKAAGQALPETIANLIANARKTLGVDALTRAPQTITDFKRALRGHPRPPPIQKAKIHPQIGEPRAEKPTPPKRE